MSVTIVALGSQGDVVPYLDLARAFRRRGYQVVMATHAAYRHRVEADDLTFRPLPMDPRDAFTPEIAAEIRRGPRRAARALESVFGPWSQPLADAMDEHLAHADAAVLSTLAWPGIHSALGHRIPAHLVSLQPLHPTGDFPPPALTARSRGRWLNRLLGTVVARRMVEPHLEAVNTVRKRHGLAPTSTAEHLALLGGTVPVSYAFSGHLVPAPTDWPAGCQVVGFLDPGSPDHWRPDPRLVEFLENGETPVFIGFGSTAPAESGALSNIIASTVEELDVRAVVQRGWADLDVDDDRVLLIDNVPHGWLFPQMRAVVHHAGAGTTAAALRAGVPSVPVPVALDQGFWAHRLHVRGASSEPIRASKLSTPRLVKGIADAVGATSVKDRAQQLGVAMRQELAADVIVERVRGQLGGS